MNARGGRVLALLLGFAMSLPSSAQDRLETHVLRAETAERLIPLLEPLLPEGAAISGRGEHLFVRADEQTQSEIRRLLEELDRAPQRLLVQVRDRSSSGTRSSGIEGGARLEAAPPTGQIAGRLKVYGTNDLRQATGTDSIQVLAGAPAAIGSGSALAVPLQALVPLPGGGIATQTGIDWIEAGRETWVLARPTRDGGVIVELAASREALLPGGAGVSGSGLTTTITGPLGAWFDVGGTRSREGSERQAGRVFGTQQLRQADQRLEMRVDVLP